MAMQVNEHNSPYSLHRLAERLRDADNFTYQDACIAADIVEMYSALVSDLREALAKVTQTT